VFLGLCSRRLLRIVSLQLLTIVVYTSLIHILIRVTGSITIILASTIETRTCRPPAAPARVSHIYSHYFSYQTDSQRFRKRKI
jgi:hypothetical protein